MSDGARDSGPSQPKPLQNAVDLEYQAMIKELHEEHKKVAQNVKGSAF